MARPTRDVRRHLLKIGELEAGDWIMLGASLLLFVALIGNWWNGGGQDNALWQSAIYFFVLLILILVTITLVIYPSLEKEVRLPALPVSTPPVFIAIGFLIFLLTLYELGRFTGVGHQVVSPGFGIYLALICGLIYLIGALIKWGGRERRLNPTS